jgi:hypothetical protein
MVRRHGNRRPVFSFVKGFLMKRWLGVTPALWLMGILTILILPLPAGAQDGQGKYVTQASVRLIRLIGTANQQGYRLHHDALSVGGGWLKKSTDSWVSLYTAKLEAGRHYRFIAAGDKEARTVNLQVQDADGKVVAHGMKTDPEPVVDFSPKATGNYLVRLRLLDSVNDLPCFCIAIMMTKKKD